MSDSPNKSEVAVSEAPQIAGLSPHPASAYTGVVLLGWMEREQAIRFLIEDCLFEKPMTEAAAESLWREWHDRAATLPERAGAAPQPIPLSQQESAYAARFLQFLGGIGVSGVQVIKIDPMQLLAAQYHIVIDLAAAHAEHCTQDGDWMERALPSSAGNPQLNMNFTRRNMDTDILIDLPHGEFIFGVHPHGGFGPKELLGYVMVMKAGERLVLGKGYHRLYGRVSAIGGAFPERICLVAQDPGVLMPPSSEVASSNDGLNIFGSRPAIFADFFTEGLAMPVYLRKKRYQLQVQARWVALNEQ
jgi:hypothetical protein